MKRPGVLTWIFALMLAVSMFGPVIAQVSAQDDETAPVAETEVATDEVIPPQVIEEPVSADSEVTQPAEEEVIPPQETAEPELIATGESQLPEVADQTPEIVSVEEIEVVAEADQVPTGDLTVISRVDVTNDPLLGAEFAVYAGSCPPTGSVVAGPAFVAMNGIYAEVVFPALTYGTYCVVETTSPGGYTPNNLTGQVDVQSPTVGTDFLHVLAPATADLTLYKVDTENARVPGAGFTIYDEPTCSTVIAAEQFVGATDDPDPGNVGRVTFTDLPVGEVCVVETTVPAGYTGSEPLYLTIGEQGTSWSVTNTLLPTADLTLYKVDTENARIPAAGFTVYDESCTTVIRSEQIVGAADDPNLGNVGRTVFEDLPIGWYCVVESTTPAGYTGSEPVILELLEDGTSWSLINERILADLSIYKVDTENARVPGAGITIYDETCTTIVRSEQIVGAADDPDPGNVGRTTFEDLPTGKYCVVETTVPEGYTGSDPVVVDVAEGGTSWSLINTRQTGTFEIEKLVCPGDPADSRIEVENGSAAAELVVCEEVTTGYTFLIYPFGEEPAIGPIGPGSYEAIPTTISASGLHQIVEVGTDLEAEFELHNGEHVVIRVLNFVWPTGSLYVSKIYCDPDVTGVEYDVYNPVATIDQIMIERPAWCYVGDASFLIYPYGDKDAVPIAFTTKDGKALIEGLPMTTAKTGSHLLVEIDTGASVHFDIAAKMITPIRVTNLYVTPKPATPETDVKELPNTGAGTTDDGQGLLPFFSLLLVVFVGGSVVRRRMTH